MAEGSTVRDVKIVTAVMPDAAADIKEAARRSGVSVSAWSAMVLTSQARTVLNAQDSLLEAAKDTVREVIGRQENLLPLLLEATRQLQEEDADDGS